MDQAEASGKTVEDALRRALSTLGATRDEVEFVVLDEGRKGGLFGRGAKDAVVRVERLRESQRGGDESAPPDTRIPRGQQSPSGRQGSQGGRREDPRGAPPRGPRPDRPDRPDRGSRSGSGRGGGSGRMTQFEEAAPKLSDADFMKPRADGTMPDAAPPAASPRSGAPRGQRPRNDAPRAARPERAERPGRDNDRPPREPRGERRSREEEPHVDPDINAEEVDFAAHVVDDMLRLWDIPAELTIREPITAGDGLGQVRAVIDISGNDLGLLIGRRGDTLLNLQYLVNLIVGRKYPGRGGVSIDVEHYRHRREETVVSLAMRMADRVRSSGSPITLEPMSAGERRLVHIALADDPELETNSIGEGDNRKVVISARR